MNMRVKSKSIPAYLAFWAVVMLLVNPCPAQEMITQEIMANGNFELDANGDGFPDGWQKKKGARYTRS